MAIIDDASWKELHKEAKNCCACSLRDTCSQVVWGTGSLMSKVMLIGEAPGKKEDEKGEPFVGAAGKFLDEMLASIGWKRDRDIFITNIVKCRPPENRDPEIQEKETCSKHWLDKQIILYNPSIIVTLGRHSGRHFLPNLHISADHGKAKRLRSGLIIYPLYHPAAALYNGGLRATLRTHCKTNTIFIKIHKKIYIYIK